MVPRFAECFNICLKVICDGERNAPRDVASSWGEEQMKDVIKHYSPNDVHNATEVAHCYKLILNKTLALKGEQ
jgi:hypothetical protein